MQIILQVLSNTKMYDPNVNFKEHILPKYKADQIGKLTSPFGSSL